jgi:uncharacterized membrane protein YozB (DUF420 family)
MCLWKQAVLFQVRGETMGLEDRSLVSRDSKVVVGPDLGFKSVVGRYLFVTMGSTVAVIVFAGFAPSFYLRAAFRPDGNISILLQIKGVVFSAWIILFLVQTILIRRGSRTLHQRLGWLAAAIAVAMVGLVVGATFEEMRRVPPTPPAPFALAFNSFDTAVFAILVSSAICLRKHAEWHKRLLLSATLILLAAPILRLLILLNGDVSHDLLVFDVLLVDLFFLVCFAADLLTRRKIHPAFLCAFALLVADQVTTFSIMAWPPWVDFANAIQRFVS